MHVQEPFESQEVEEDPSELHPHAIRNNNYLLCLNFNKLFGTSFVLKKTYQSTEIQMSNTQEYNYYYHTYLQCNQGYMCILHLNCMKWRMIHEGHTHMLKEITIIYLVVMFAIQ